MRVLIVSKFFYARGGADVVAMTTRELLLASGHEVRVFAMDYPENIPLEEAATFASQIEFGKGGLVSNVKAFARLMGVDNVVPRFKKVLRDFRPEVVHFHNIHSYLSPVVVTLSRQFGARTVWTVHDLKLLCPAYLGRRPDGSHCTDCVSSGRFHVVDHKCMKNSILASVMALLEARRWSREKLNAATDAFITPSYFMARMMRRGGYDAAKLHVLNNFIDPMKLEVILSAPARPESEPAYFVYVGRLSAEKGVVTLVQAAMKAGVDLRIAGDGPLRGELEEMAADSPNIRFLGQLGAAEVAALMRDAAASILPSECYENNPLSVIESLCAGTPVIGADIGGIPELIVPGVSGEHFRSGSAEDLAVILDRFDPARYNRAEISREAIERFSQHTHFRKLLEIYEGK